MENEVPDYFKDPFDEACKKATKRLNELFPKYQPLHADATVWAAGVISLYEESKARHEDDPPSTDTMVLGELVKISFLLMTLIRQNDCILQNSIKK